MTNISYDRKRQKNRWECINLLLQQSRITRITVFNSISVAPLYCCVPIWHTDSTKQLTIKRQPWTLFLQARSKNSLGTKIHRTTSLIKKNYNNFEATRRFWTSTFQPFAQPKRTKPTQPMPKWIWIFFQESLQPRTPNGGYGTRGFGCPSAR